jgi:hypothetical protein
MRYRHAILLMLGFSTLFAQDKLAQDKAAQDKPAQDKPAQEKPILVPQMQLPALQGSITAFKSMPPDITLIPHGEGARNGHLWIRNIGHALVIAGEVDGDEPDFPKNQNWILSKDHIEVWLAASTDIAMPVIGWGNQFDQNEFPKGQDSCADLGKNGMGTPDTLQARQKKCRDWVGTQQRYRPVFNRLFTRQWLLTDYYSVESYATPAYEAITRNFASDQPRYSEEVPDMLKPQGKIQMWVSRAWVSHDRPAYTFQIEIPYTSFPPLPTLELRDLRLMVDVFSPAPPGKKMGPFSTSSPFRVFGKPETFNWIRLDPARTFQMTPCDIGLAGADKYRDEHPGWFIPHASESTGWQSDAFILVNESHGYAYDPEGLSPVVRRIHNFWHGISMGEWVCGPDLAYRKGETFKQLGEVVGEEGFDAKRLPDDTLLIKSGPRVYGSEFGSGQCGACPRVDMRIFAVNQDLKLYKALDLGGIIDTDGRSEDFSFTDDWSKVIQFEQPPDNEKGEPGPWSSTTWCLKHLEYEKCEEKQNAEPPSPPLLKELRNPD